MRFGWLILLYRPSRIQESLLFPFVLETRLRTIHTLTVFLLLIIQTHNVDSFWSKCHPLFISLLTHSCEWGLTKLILTKGPSLDTRRYPTHYLHLISTPCEMNLPVGTDNDEACVLWPNLATWRVVENLPFLWLTSHYLYPSEERSHHTRWPLILRFTQPPRTPFGVGSMVCLNHILNLYQYFQRTLPFFKRGWMYIYAHKNPFFSIFVICSLEGIRTTCEAFTIFLTPKSCFVLSR